MPDGAGAKLLGSNTELRGSWRSGLGVTVFRYAVGSCDLTTGKKIDLLKEQNYSFNAAEIGKEYNFVVHFSKNNLSDSPKSIITSNTLNENTSVYNTPSNVVIKFDMPALSL